MNNDVIYALKSKFYGYDFFEDKNVVIRKNASCLFIIYDGVQENKLEVIVKEILYIIALN